MATRFRNCINALAAGAPSRMTTSSDSTSALRLPHDHQAGVRVVRELARDAAEQEAPQAREPARADDDQVGVLLLGHVEDHLRRFALARVGDDLEPFGLDLAL